MCELTSSLLVLLKMFLRIRIEPHPLMQAAKFSWTQDSLLRTMKRDLMDINYSTVLIQSQHIFILQAYLFNLLKKRNATHMSRVHRSHSTMV